MGFRDRGCLGRAEGRGDAVGVEGTEIPVAINVEIDRRRGAGKAVGSGRPLAAVGESVTPPSSAGSVRVEAVSSTSNE
jgi:hypothetical protein